MRHLKKRVDFCLGIAEIAEAIKEGRPSRLSSQYCLHVNEIVFAINEASESGSTHIVKTTFEPMDPMPWSKP